MDTVLPPLDSSLLLSSYCQCDSCIRHAFPLIFLLGRIQQVTGWGTATKLAAMCQRLGVCGFAVFIAGSPQVAGYVPGCWSRVEAMFHMDYLRKEGYLCQFPTTYRAWWLWRKEKERYKIRGIGNNYSIDSK